MDLVQQELTNKNALVTFSGGLDSFLAAILMIYKDFNVKLISFDNGSIMGIERVFHGAQRLINMYGTDRMEHVGVYTVWGLKHKLSEHFKYSNPKELVEKYPNLPYHQLECLCCHTAMFAKAVAYCKARGISTLVEGSRISQGFIIEVPGMIEVYRSICDKYDVDLVLPVLNISDDIERALELSSYNFIPKAYEPQCTLGLPIKNSLTPEQISEFVRYFNDNILGIVHSNIASLERTLRFIKPKLRFEDYKDIKVEA